jgi:hypothetical protein
LNHEALRRLACDDIGIRTEETQLDTVGSARIYPGKLDVMVSQ